MKILYTLVLAILLGSSAFAQDTKKVIKLSEPVQITDTFEVYGEKVGDYEKSKTLTEVLMADYNNSSSVVVSTSIAEVCEKKGCFFIAQEGDYSARITFKDYGFFVPTDSKGKEVTIIGELSKKVLSEEKAKHYADDAGKSTDNIQGKQIEYSIVASTVIIQKERKNQE
ncbi:MAG: DUF4920 domain-containing protein [Balneola sp.]|nr:DUF4920 domain-containing protein [Balneola sp.]MBO6650747.1 DUF4920 domain-containing protein [Balneola sp.]MBO6710660.1 DUF4920 domain-containing protein [Balneola sp.]MBO6799346.1 DUF4920 domain-containing protein [Balneola sp.]MBO6869525.1 DUF4920 domain-containing protein [Balneola sp.]